MQRGTCKVSDARITLTLHRTRCIHTSMNLMQMKFISYIYTLFYIVFFVHYLWNFDLNLANKRRRKVIMFNSRHPDMTSIERYVGQSTIAFMYGVVHGCINLVGPK